MGISSNGQRVNARACTSTDCSVVAVFSDGDGVHVIGEREGELFRGSTLWREINVEGRSAFIHASLLNAISP